MKRSVQEVIDRAFNAFESPVSRKGYHADWNRYIAWCDNEVLRVERATVQDVQRYMDQMQTDDYAKSTRGRMLSVVREGYRVLYVAGLVTSNPAREVKVPRDGRDLRTPWLDEERLRQLLAAPVDVNDWRSRRDHLIVLVLVTMGLRASEVARIQVTDFEWIGDGGRLLHKVKRGKLASTGVPRSLAADLKEWIRWAGLGRGGNIFPGDERGGVLTPLEVYKAVKRQGALVDLKVTPHALRRSFVTYLVKAGVGLDRIQRAVSHSSVTTTERYQKAALAANDALGEAMDVLRPKRGK